MLTLVSLLLFLLSSGLLVWYFLRGDHGPKERKSALLVAAGFGVLGIIVAVGLELLLPNPTSPTITVPLLFLICLAVGIIEESAKFIPLALFIRKKSYFNEHTDGIIYFGIAGLTFGLIENLTYLFVYKNRLGGSELTGIFRLVVLFFFHAASTGIVGYYFAKAKIHQQSMIRPILALGTLAIFHGTYDFLFFFAATAYRNSYLISQNTALLVIVALVAGLIMSALLNTCLFLYYRRARQWDVSIGLAVDPKLNQAAVYNQPQTFSQNPGASIQQLPPAPIGSTSTSAAEMTNVVRSTDNVIARPTDSLVKHME